MIRGAVFAFMLDLLSLIVGLQPNGSTQSFVVCASMTPLAMVIVAVLFETSIIEILSPKISFALLIILPFKISSNDLPVFFCNLVDNSVL